MTTENTEFMQRIYPTQMFQSWWSRHGIECVQEAGEILWIPRLLQHAVLNMGETIGVTGEHCGDHKNAIKFEECRDLQQLNEEHVQSLNKFRKVTGARKII